MRTNGMYKLPRPLALAKVPIGFLSDPNFSDRTEYENILTLYRYTWEKFYKIHTEKMKVVMASRNLEKRILQK